MKKNNTGWYLAALNEKTHGSTALRVRFNNRNKNPLIDCARMTPANHAKMTRDDNGVLHRLKHKPYNSKAQQKSMRKFNQFARSCGMILAS